MPDVTQLCVYLARILDDGQDRITEIEGKFKAYLEANPQGTFAPYLVATALIIQLPPSGYPAGAQRAETLIRRSLEVK